MGLVKKLISGIPFADGADAEVMEDSIYEIYQKDSKRVKRFMYEMNIVPSSWQIK